MVMGTGAAFTDEDEFSPQYQEAAEVLTNLKVIQGYEDGSYFLPQRNITRAQVATMIYRAATGDVNNTQVGQYVDYDQFNDVSATDWHAGYVNYCANAELIKGFTPDTFGPNKNVTGYQVLAMILRAVGYDQNDEFTGSGWEIRTASIAESLGILDNVQDATLGQPATRELVAELIFQAMIVPTVEYTVAFGYQPVWPRETLGEREFGLEQISGEITAVGRTAGTTEFNDKTVVAKTDTAWTDIGYGAYVWTVPTSGSKALTAVSDVSITGESLLTTTDGTSVADADVTIENDAHLYYNGDYVGQIKVNANGDVTNVNGGDVDSNLVDKAPLTGVKVDYIDNDNGGRAEAVVVTEYTTAKITGIATDSTSSGTSATTPSNIYFTTFNKGIESTVSNVKDSNVVSDAAVAVNDIVTFVDYQGLDKESSRYTFVAPAATETLNKVVRDNTNEEYYVVGDVDLYKSEITDMDVSALATNNVGKDITYYVDEYGYVILAGEYSAPTQYLFGISNNHTDGNTDVATGKVVFTDGSVSNVSIASVGTSTDLENDDIKDVLYTYTTNSDNEYALTASNTAINGNSASHADDSVYVNLNGTRYYVNNQTIVVDVTAVRDDGATAATVYTGTTAIPAFDYADGYFVANADNYVSLMFIYDYGTYGTDTFMIYDTAPNTVTTSNNAKVYTMNVVRDGVEGTVDLTEAQYNAITEKEKGLGVGIYTIDDENTNGIEDYTSYAEVYGKLTWNNDTITWTNLDNSSDWDAYSYTENTTITVLNITKGEVETFTGLTAGQTIPWVGSNSANARGFVVTDANGNVAEHIYFVVGDTASNANRDYSVKANEAADGSYTWYYVKDGYITGFENVSAKTYDVTVDGAVWKTVTQGTEISVPDQGKGGTGAKVTIGTNDPAYMEYGKSISVTDDVIIETGCVAWTLNDGDPIPVKYTQRATNIADALGASLSGTYVQYTKDGQTSNMKSVSGATLWADADTAFQDGFYQVNIGSLSGQTTKVTAGTLYTADGSVVSTIADNSTYYAKTGTVIAVYADATSTPDATYTVTNTNLTIPKV
ncbi:MAG: S-layer homology domain-containing protein [Evtepia sp.]